VLKNLRIIVSSLVLFINLVALQWSVAFGKAAMPAAAVLAIGVHLVPSMRMLAGPNTLVMVLAGYCGLCRHALQIALDHLLRF